MIAIREDELNPHGLDDARRFFSPLAPVLQVTMITGILKGKQSQRASQAATIEVRRLPRQVMRQ